MQSAAFLELFSATSNSEIRRYAEHVACTNVGTDCLSLEVNFYGTVVRADMRWLLSSDASCL